MDTNPTPTEVLDTALQSKPGEGSRLTFPTTQDRERFRWRCYSAMAVEARASRRELDRGERDWGLPSHPWKAVKVVRQGALGLWVGLTLDNEVMIVEGVTQEAED